MTEIAILWLKRTTLTTCGYFHYYQEKFFFLKRKHLWGPVLGSVAEDVQALYYCGI